MKDSGYIAIDARNKNEFLKAFVPGTLSLDMANMQFGLWVGKLFAPTSKFIFVCEAGKEEEIIIRLSRIGYDNVAGYLDGGVDAW